jgi:hypothetical protein
MVRTSPAWLNALTTLYGACPRPRTSRGQRSLVLVDVGGVAEKKQIADLVEPDAGVHHADAGDDNR